MSVVVTGLGTANGFGRGAERTWTALLAGERALSIFDQVGAISLCPDLPRDLLGPRDRADQLARWAAEEALEHAKFEITPQSAPRVGLLLGTTLGGIGHWLPKLRGDTADRHFGYGGSANVLATALGIGGPVEVPSVACASSNVALGMGRELIRSGRCDVVIAGGADALNDFVVAGFQSLKALDPDPCRPFDVARKGLNLGEAACFLVLESEAHARARGVSILARFSGYGISADAVHMTGPDRNGGGAARAMAAAIADEKIDPGSIDFVSAHGTATVFNDLMEARALEGALGDRAHSIPVNSIKGALGHTLGAAGALEALACVRTLETDTIAPTAGHQHRDPEIPLDVVAGSARHQEVRVALSTSSGFGGTNAAVLFTKA